MDSVTFGRYWQQHYGEAPLLGRKLRDLYPQRWLRIHSLPESQRYAQTVEEHGEILRRHNSAIDELVGPAQPCELIFCHYGEESQLPDDVRSALERLQPTFLQTLAPAVSDLEHEYALLHASFTWSYGCLDPVLLAVAEDILETPLLVSTTYQRILAPYDGGMDFIFESSEVRDRYRKRFAEWLSKHPAGL